MCVLIFFFFKQKTAYEMRISDWSSDVCSSDLLASGTWTVGLPGCHARGSAPAASRRGRVHPHSAPDRNLRRTVSMCCVHHCPMSLRNTQVGWCDPPVPGMSPGRIGYRSMRSEEHTSELQSLMRTSYAVFCLK